MWMISPELMCAQHITGEHNEIHKHRHNFVKKHRLDGRFAGFVQIEPASMEKRHDELARFLNHKSPYKQPDIEHLPLLQQAAKVDFLWNFTDLFFRCSNCREKIIQFFNRRKA
jgi:hypothetical protein